MMKSEHTSDNCKYIRCLKIAVLFTVISLMEHCISLIWQNHACFESLRLFILVIGVFVLPIVIYIAWFIAAYQYLIYKYQNYKDNTNKVDYVVIFLNVLFMLFAGRFAINSLTDTISYVAENWNLLESLFHCTMIKTGVTIGWLVCFGCCILNNTIHKKRFVLIKRSVILVFVVVFALILLYFESGVESYIFSETEKVWVQKMTEYYYEHGTEASPFVRN